MTETSKDPHAPTADKAEPAPGLRIKDPRDTDHPTGTAQAKENAETESPS